MDRINLTVGGTIKDVAALPALTDEMAAIIENDLPGTLVFETYLDTENSRFSIHEKAAAVAEIDVAMCLGDPGDEARAVLEEMGFDFYASYARARG